MKIISSARHAIISPKKAKEMASLIRGRTVEEASHLLRNIPRKSALLFLKVLRSAAANAENNHNIASAGLVICSAHAMKASVIRRHMPQARGSAHLIRKRRSHLFLELEAPEGI